MADTGTGKGAAGAAAGGGKAKATDKLGEAEVLNLVLDYLATKGFTEAEQTLRQSVSASQGSPKKGHNSNQQSGMHVPTHAGACCGSQETGIAGARRAHTRTLRAMRRAQELPIHAARAISSRKT